MRSELSANDWALLEAASKTEKYEAIGPLLRLVEKQEAILRQRRYRRRGLISLIIAAFWTVSSYLI